MKLYGEELRKSIEASKAHYLELMEDRARRIANWETDEDDCFLSQRCEENAISECNMQLEILKGDGCMDYEAWFDGDKEVSVRWVKTRYGYALVYNGIFASSEKAIEKKTGLTRKTIRVPAWTKFWSNGSGMLGVYSGSYEVVRWHTNMVTGEYVGYPD